MIKMVNEFKVAAVRFAHPNPMQICGCAWIYRWTKKLWKIRTGPPGLRVAGPLQAVGCWAVGLLLAIPCFECLKGREKIVYWCPKH